MPRRAARCLALVIALLATALGGPAFADTVYVVSFTTGELARYDSTNPAGTKTVLTGSGAMTKPSAIAIGPDGNLYIGESGDGASIAPKITRYTVATGSLSTIHTFAAFDVFPGSLAFKSTNLLIGRNPFYGITGPIVQLANATSGPLAVSDYTTGGSLATSPGLALGGDGRLYVSDQTYDFGTLIATGPVKRFDAAGAYVGELIASGSTSGLYGPTGLAISGSTLYTASIMDGSILQTNLGSDITTAFASAGGAFEVGPLGLLADGTLLAGSPSGSGSIYRFGTNGALLETYSSGLGQIGGIVTVAVPEPGAITLAVGGLAAVGWLARRTRRPIRR